MAARKWTAGERVLFGARSGAIASDAVPREGGLIPIDMGDGTRWNVEPEVIRRVDKEPEPEPPPRAHAMTQLATRHKAVVGPREEK